MTDWVREQVVCDRCGASNTIDVFHSVNVTVDPDLKPRFLAGELTRTACTGCGLESELIYDLLYHDMEQRLLLYRCPPRPGNLRPDPNGNPGFDLLGTMPDYVRRVVPNTRQLIEKVRIFDASLDDHAVEITKALMLERAGHPDEASLLFDRFDESPADDPAILLVDITNNGNWVHLHVPWSVYSSIQELFGRRVLEPGHRGSSEWVYIDRTWALSIIEGLPPSG